jgi:hypothetical protein
MPRALMIQALFIRIRAVNVPEIVEDGERLAVLKNPSPVVMPWGLD